MMQEVRGSKVLEPRFYRHRIPNRKVSEPEMQNQKTEQDYAQAKSAILNYYTNIPIHLQQIERGELEDQAKRYSKRPVRLETKCVIYLRQHATDYDSIIGTIFHPRKLFPGKFQRHVLRFERKTWIDLSKKRVLTDIAEEYPWLNGPYKGQQLRELHSDYLIHLLGQDFVRHCFRSRIERELAARHVN